MKLISMTEFVLEQDKQRKDFSRHENQNVLAIIINYANFLTQPLTLGMFVPCDEDGNVLKKPERNRYLASSERWGVSELNPEWKEYDEAKERVLFEGCVLEYDDHRVPFIKINNWEIMPTNDYLGWDENGNEQYFHESIESMIGWIEDIELTPTALKQIGL